MRCRAGNTPICASRPRAWALRADGDEIADTYADVNKLFGDIVKVTPSSKVVGDMALFMVTNGLTPMDVLTPDKKLNFPKSVVEMMQGQLGFPEGGWPKVLQKIILDSSGAKPIVGRPGRKDAADRFCRHAQKTRRRDRPARQGYRRAFLCMYPQVYLDYDKHVRLYDNTSVIPTPAFFYGLQSGEEISVEIEPGKVLILRYLTTGEPREDGTRTVFFELNGQPREVNVPDRKLEGNLHKQPKADPDNPAHIAAPMPGKVSTVAVKKGQNVKQGERLLSIEAMKMETAVYSPRGEGGGRAGETGNDREARDLLIVLEG